jgi:hypothetical protein
MADAAHRHQPTVKPLRGDAPVVWDAPSDRSPTLRAHDAGASASDSLRCVLDDRRAHAWRGDDSLAAYVDGAPAILLSTVAGAPITVPAFNAAKCEAHN